MEIQMKKIAIVGCGSRGLYHLENLMKMDDVEVVAFCDLISERAEDLASHAGEGAVFTDFSRMCDEAGPDAVFICTPPYCHGEIELEAIRRGIHIFVDPPLALSLDTAEKIRTEAEARGIITSVGCEERYCAFTYEAAKFIAEQDVITIDCMDIGGVGEKFWMRDIELSGGRITESTIRHLDTLRFIFGEPDEVFAYSARGFVGGIVNYDTDDAVSAVVRFKNGTLATVTAGSYAGSYAASESRITLRSAKMTATLHLGKGFETIGKYVSEDAEESVPDECDCAADCDRAFIDAIIENDPSRVRSDYADGVRTLAFAEAIRRSVNEGRAVKVNI